MQYRRLGRSRLEVLAPFKNAKLGVLFHRSPYTAAEMRRGPR
jgi:hypothetical protein